MLSGRQEESSGVHRGLKQCMKRTPTQFDSRQCLFPKATLLKMWTCGKKEDVRAFFYLSEVSNSPGVSPFDAHNICSNVKLEVVHDFAFFQVEFNRVTNLNIRVRESDRSSVVSGDVRNGSSADICLHDFAKLVLKHITLAEPFIFIGSRESGADSKKFLFCEPEMVLNKTIII